MQHKRYKHVDLSQEGVVCALLARWDASARQRHQTLTMHVVIAGGRMFISYIGNT
jgi:hypothetical protein